MHPISKQGCFPEWPNGADCKSAVFRLRWFESISTHKEKEDVTLLPHPLFTLRAYTASGAQCRQYRRCNRCDKLNHEFYCFLFSHSRSLVLVLITLCFVISSPLLVISSVVERSPSVAVKISPCATLSRDDMGARLIVGYVVVLASAKASFCVRLALNSASQTSFSGSGW